MPVYEYQCGSCQRVHELLVRGFATEERECPECSGPMRKLISRSSFHLKGGGWYSDGYCNRKVDRCPDMKTGEAAGKGSSQTCSACDS